MPTPRKQRSIRYILGERQQGVSWSDDRDNPLSPAFVPLTHRSERDRMRWWARNAQRRKRTLTHTVYDA